MFLFLDVNVDLFQQSHVQKQTIVEWQAQEKKIENELTKEKKSVELATRVLQLI